MMFGIKIIHFCCSGVISCGKPQWSLQEQWHTHTHTHTHTHARTEESHPKRLTQTLSHSLEFLPCVELSLRFWVPGRDLAACLSHKVPRSHLKTHSLPRTSLPRRKTATHKGSKLGTTQACVRGYIGVRLCPCHGKKHHGCQYATCVPFVVWCYGRGAVWSKIAGCW